MGEAAQAFEGLNSYGSMIAGGGGGGSTSHPKVFVTILLFDKDHQLVDATFDQIDGGEQIGATPTAHDHMMAEYEVTIPGYAYVFVSNENPTYVEAYFDDVTVTHTPTNILQYNEYYPFGLQTASSWTRDLPAGQAGDNTNQFLYNAGNELNEESGWYETFYRGYDPALGRMLQVDPMVDKYASLTPYNYAFNDPVYWNDPLGDDSAYGSRNSWASYRGTSVGGGGDSWKSRGPQDAHAGAGAMFGSSFYWDTYGGGFAAYSRGINYGGNDYHADAARVKNDQMTHEEYGMKYGDAVYVVESSDGTYLYGDRSFVDDFSGDDLEKSWYRAQNMGTKNRLMAQNGRQMQAGIFGGLSQEDLKAIQPYSDPLLSIAGAGISMAETVALARAFQLQGLSSTLNVTRLATAAKFAKGAGAVGLVLGAAGAGINIYTGNGHGNDVLDIAVMAGAGLVGIAVGAVALPWIAGGAMVYGVLSFTFQDQINASGIGQTAASIGNSVLTYFGSDIKIK